MNFREWLMVNEAGMGTIKSRPKGPTAPDNPFVGYRGQMWGPSAHMYHEPEKLQKPWDQPAAAFVTGIGSTYQKELQKKGLIPTAWPDLGDVPRGDGKTEELMTFPLVIPRVQSFSDEDGFDVSDDMANKYILIWERDKQEFYRLLRHPDPRSEEELARAQKFTGELLKAGIRNRLEDKELLHLIDFEGGEFSPNVATGSDGIMYMSMAARFDKKPVPGEAPAKIPPPQQPYQQPQQQPYQQPRQ